MLNTVVSGLSANSGSLGFVLGTGGNEGVKASFWSVHTGNKRVSISHYPDLLFHFLHLWVLFPFLYYMTLNINDNYKNVTSWVIHAFWLVLINDLSEKRYRHDINIDNIFLWHESSSNRSHCGKNINNILSLAWCASFLLLPHFYIICDLLLNKGTATKTIW